ncbi:type I-U CRISPR-associated protein Csb2 [uncultured Desulfovibrio sp.]|uniref:type I-G CRISPR-associated protein Csb2 n=1 Tax=uncultured Desulfovibrio sp. TaxID=167968 RepID=UPI002629C6D5|nr:type I-U CRISPR-associated protein Csb2 [uncultured Desulfovibrio sp.]
MMAVLELCFLAGRYHATPWGRNVNEGEPEWPPSPFRLARALLDIWYRRHSEVPAGDMDSCLAMLAGSPRMAVPPSGRMAVKCYLDQNKREEDRQPVIDAFVSMAKAAPLYMELPADSTENSLRLLDSLAGELNYLGRSESWVSARILSALPGGVEWNCEPGSGIQVHGLLPEAAYLELPFLPKQGKGRNLRDCTWLEALSLSTSQLQAEGWNRHPLAQPCGYTLHTRESLLVSRAEKTTGLCVTYAMKAQPLPSVTQTLPLAERVRAGLMSCHRRICGGEVTRVSPLFSGKDVAGQPLRGHRHAFFWPCDLDRDGKIDHVRVVCKGAVTEDERLALESIRRLWVRGADLGELVLLHALPLDSMEQTQTVISATPVVFGRHYKVRQGNFDAWLASEVRRCCAEQGLPAPEHIESLPELPRWDGAPVPWHDFVRQRKNVAPRRGYGFRLTFAAPVAVPFALGALAHFGMGLFVAEKRDW